MDKKLTKNYIYSVIYQLLIVVTPFITTPYLTRVMGSKMLSLNDLTGNYAQWFVLFGIMGVNIYGNREIARVRDDKKELSKSFFEIFSMQFISMVVSSIAYILFVIVSKSNYTNLLIAQGITLLGVSLDITWFFYGVEDFKKASIRNMAVKILNVALIIMLIKGPADLLKFILLNSLLGVFGQLVMWVQLRHYVHFEKVTLKGIIRHIKPNIALFVPQIAISVYSLLNVPMLGFLYPNISHVNYYKQSQQFVKMFLFFITSIGSVMLPRISNVFNKGDVDAVNSYLSKTLRFSLYLAIPMIFGIFGLIQNFVDWFLPLEYSEVGSLIIYTSPIILFISLSNVFGTQYMVPIGDYKHYTLSVIVGAIVNFISNFIFMPNLGAYGAVISTVLAELAVTLTQWIFVRKVLKLEIQLSEILKIIICSFIMVSAVISIGKQGNSFLINLMQIGAGSIAYVVALFVLKAPLFIEISNKFIKRGVKGEA